MADTPLSSDGLDGPARWGRWPGGDRSRPRGASGSLLPLALQGGDSVTAASHSHLTRSRWLNQALRATLRALSPTGRPTISNPDRKCVDSVLVSGREQMEKKRTWARGGRGQRASGPCSLRHLRCNSAALAGPRPQPFHQPHNGSHISKSRTGFHHHHPVSPRRTALAHRASGCERARKAGPLARGLHFAERE